MRLATALLFFVQIALCGGAPAARMRTRTRAAAAVAAPGRQSNVCNSWRTALRKIQAKRRVEGRGRSSTAASEPPTRRRRVDNTNRVDRNPHNRSGRGAAGTGPRRRSRGETVLAAGLAAAAPPVATEQVTMQQAQGESFVDSVVGPLVQDV